jgi:high-affinity nickel-transport protein
MTVLVAFFVASVYLAGVVDELTGVGGPIAAYGGIADHFEVLGYLIVGAFVLARGGAVAVWKLSGLPERYRS